MKTSLRFLYCIFALGCATAAAWAQTHAGVIKAMKVTGTVTRLAADGSQQAVTDGTLLTESDAIVTGDGSGVVLVFMNGSSVKLGAKSKLAIEEFKMDPLADDIAIAKLKAEPSVSKTNLNLAYGDMVGDVKKLNTASSYNIKTPAGAAGIRGTTFRIVFTPALDGRSATFQLSTSEGLVLFTGTTSSNPVPVGAGTEVVVAAEVNTATGQVTSTQIQTQGISQEATREIQTAVTEAIQQAQTQAVFTPAEQSAPPPSSSSSSSSSSTSNNQASANTSSEQTPNESAGAAPAANTGSTLPTIPQITTPQPIDTSAISRSN